MSRDVRWFFLCVNAASIVKVVVVGGSTWAVGLGAACAGYWAWSLVVLDD